MKANKLICAAALLAAAYAAMRGLAEPAKPLPPIAALEAQARQIDGKTCAIVGGDAYVRDTLKKTWKFYTHLYDVDFFQKNYVVENGITYRLDKEGGRRHAMAKHFQADFENAASLNELIGEKCRFTGFVLQSPSAPTVADYVKLRQAMLKGERSFIDNSVQPSSEQAHSGKQSLRAHSVAKSREMQCAKAHLESEFLHFAKGDDYWFSGWYFIADGMPYTIADLKSGWIEGTPGLRLRLENGAPEFELKWADKPSYKQRSTPPVAFPLHRWVHVQIHLKLSDEEDGVNELWMDGRQLIQAKGRNLPVAEAIYNHLEIGISAAMQEATVFVDDVEVSDQPVGMVKDQSKDR